MANKHSHIQDLRANRQLQSFIDLYWDTLTTEQQLGIEREIRDFKKFYQKQRSADKKTALLQFYQLADIIIKEFFAKSGTTASCKEGCSFCCHIPVDISEDEAAVIADYCTKNKIPISGAYLINQISKKLQVGKLVPDAACVFLKENRCSIYPVRPMNCRKYFVYSPAALCEKASKSDIPTKVVEVFNLVLETRLCGIHNIKLNRGVMQEMLLPYAK